MNKLAETETEQTEEKRLDDIACAGDMFKHFEREPPSIPGKDLHRQ